METVPASTILKEQTVFCDLINKFHQGVSASLLCAVKPKEIEILHKANIHLQKASSEMLQTLGPEYFTDFGDVNDLEALSNFLVQLTDVEAVLTPFRRAVVKVHELNMFQRLDDMNPVYSGCLVAFGKRMLNALEYCLSHNLFYPIHEHIKLAQVELNQLRGSKHPAEDAPCGQSADKKSKLY